MKSFGVERLVWKSTGVGFEGVVPPGTGDGFPNGLLPLKVEPLTLVVVDLGGLLLFLPSVLDSISFFSCSTLLVGVRLLADLPGSFIGFPS